MYLQWGQLDRSSDLSPGLAKSPAHGPPTHPGPRELLTLRWRKGDQGWEG